MRHARAVISMLLCVCFAFGGCTRLSVSGQRLSPAETVYPTPCEERLRTDQEDSEPVRSAQYLSMYMDRVTMAPKLLDGTTGFVWRMLGDNADAMAYPVAVTLTGSGGSYRLDSQNNAVAFGTARYNLTDAGVDVTYVMAADRDTAQKKADAVSDGDVWCSLTLRYALSGQTLTVTVPAEKLVCARNWTVTDVTLLPLLGAADDARSDYIVLPDGSGAVMDLGYIDENTRQAAFDVYGGDPACGVSANPAAALPVFGFKRGDSAFAALITGGSEYAVIRANRAGEGEYSRVYASFAPAPQYRGENAVYLGQAAQTDLQVTYMFLSGKDADYSGMAAALRDLLLQQGLLRRTVSDPDAFAMHLTIVGAAGGETLSPASSLREMLSSLKGRGVDDVAVRYSGAFKGGLAQDELYSTRIAPEIGSYSAMEELEGTIRALGYRLYPDVDIFSAGRSYADNASAFDLSGSKSVCRLSDPLAMQDHTNARLSARIGADLALTGQLNENEALYSQNKTYEMYLTRLERLLEQYPGFLRSKYTTDFDGLCVTDAGTILYSDGYRTRAQARDDVASLLQATSEKTRLTVDGGNLYTLYSAESVSHMDTNTAYLESDAYYPIPFSQLILHGSVTMSGEPVDAGDKLYRFEMLKSIEYGMMPSFAWVFSPDSIFYYGYYVQNDKLSEVVDFFHESAAALGDLSGRAMLSHERVTTDSEGEPLTGVYKVTYEGGVSIYINYNATVKTTDGNIIIKPYSSVRIEA